MITTSPRTTTTTPAESATTDRSTARTAVIAGAVAAVATTVIGIIAKATDVPLVVSALKVQVPAFAVFTLVGAAIGGLLATQLQKRAAQPRRAFLVTTIALTALSFVPDLAADATTATKLTLVGAHIVAAAVIIPALAGRLSASAAG
ncbi:MAG TPA: DUF6069 family protein [Acidimicrobiales bacterium]|nr:DUF6069 family protein [Acidimicrobiales bacterium]